MLVEDRDNDCIYRHRKARNGWSVVGNGLHGSDLFVQYNRVAAEDAMKKALNLWFLTVPIGCFLERNSDRE